MNLKLQKFFVRTNPMRVLIAVFVFMLLMVGLPELLYVAVPEAWYYVKPDFFFYASVFLPILTSIVTILIAFGRVGNWKSWLLFGEKGKVKNLWRTLVVLPFLFVAVMVVQFSLQIILISIFGDAFLDDAKLLDEILQPAGVASGVFLFIIIGMVAPLFEELVMRGVIFRSLRKNYQFWFSAVLSSLMFALLHGFISQIPFAFVSGIVLAWLYEHYNDMRIVVAYHILNNSVLYLLVVFAPDIGETGQAVAMLW